MWSVLRSWLPEGRLLTDAVFARRHTWIVRLCLLQAATTGIAAFTLGQGFGNGLLCVVVIGVPALVARWVRLSRGWRTAAAATSLTLSAVVLVHLVPGVTETHFHFFVMVAVAALYQDWIAFLIALVIVIVHHAVLGTLDAGTVFGGGHTGAHGFEHSPLFWAFVHGAFVLAASCAHLVGWRLNEQQVLHDPLTGLANRLSLTETLHRRLLRGGDVSVLYVDLDDFHGVNDSRGHGAGDHLLTTVGRRMSDQLRAGDVVARLGADEFAVVLDGGLDDARAVAERILTAVAAPTVIDTRPITIRASIGVADVASAADHCASTVLSNAELAVSLAKAEGKGRVSVYAEGMAVRARCRAELADDLAGALAAGDQLAVHYQDIVALPGGSVVGYEALLRWQHPQRGAVSPVEFIPLAEGTGSIVAIGSWVLGQATSYAARRSAVAGRAVSVSVNVSGSQLREPDFVDVVVHALVAGELPAAQLIVEVTESLLVEDTTAVARLAQLRALGVRVAIDDFGTGYSSLSYLRYLPADRLKIDRSFVADLGHDEVSTALVSTVIDLGRALGMDIVAEGVETAEQRTALSALGCTHGQGWLFGRPAAPLDDPDVRDVAGAADTTSLQLT